uniref:Uncharacterized protein n=1 Tax=Anguilla anguilla TaxID=7936 RepID=A0A0E9USI9_ANGAN
MCRVHIRTLKIILLLREEASYAISSHMFCSHMKIVVHI